MKTSTEYRELSRRIKAASTDAAKLHKLEKSATRIYDAGLMTPAELSRLYGMIMHRLARVKPKFFIQHDGLGYIHNTPDLDEIPRHAAESFAFLLNTPEHRGKRYTGPQFAQIIREHYDAETGDHATRAIVNLLETL